MRQHQSENFRSPVIEELTDIVWITRQHGLLVRPSRPSDSDGRFDLILRNGALWAVIGATRLPPVKNSRQSRA